MSVVAKIFDRQSTTLVVSPSWFLYSSRLLDIKYLGCIHLWILEKDIFIFSGRELRVYLSISLSFFPPKLGAGRATNNFFMVLSIPFSSLVPQISLLSFAWLSLWGGSTHPNGKFLIFLLFDTSSGFASLVPRSLTPYVVFPRKSHKFILSGCKYISRARKYMFFIHSFLATKCRLLVFMMP